MPSEKDAYSIRVPPLAAVSAHDVVVEYDLELPALFFGHLFFDHLGEMTAAVKALLFSRDGQENNGRWKLQAAQDAGAFKADGGTAGIVVGARRGVGGVVIVTIARVVVARNQKRCVWLPQRLCPAERHRRSRSQLAWARGLPPVL